VHQTSCVDRPQPLIADQVDITLANTVIAIQVSPTGTALLVSIENTCDPVTFFEAVKDAK